MKRKWRRRNYFIKRDLQGKYIFSFFIFVIAGSYLFTAIFGFLSLDTMTIVYKDYNLQLGKTPFVLLKEILRAQWIFIVTCGVLVVVAAMFITHRFAGPLYRFERSLEEMTKGNFNFEITLRSKDEAKELAKLLNEFNTTLSSRLREARDLADAAGKHLGSARRAVSDASSIAEIDEAAALVNKLGDVLHGFRLKNDG
jgi:methyl-accepting chemotaxis protein